MVEVFKTNVDQPEQARHLLTLLNQQFPRFRLTFDLDDCDNVLRAEGSHVQPECIIDLLITRGYECEVLM